MVSAVDLLTIVYPQIPAPHTWALPTHWGLCWWHLPFPILYTHNTALALPLALSNLGGASCRVQ